MEQLVRAMANKVDNDDVVGYLVSCCMKSFADEYQIITSARVGKSFTSPYRLYAALLGKIFHTISRGHPEPEQLLDRIIQEALEDFKEALKDETKTDGEFTVVGKL